MNITVNILVIFSMILSSLSSVLIQSSPFSPAQTQMEENTQTVLAPTAAAPTQTASPTVPATLAPSLTLQPSATSLQPTSTVPQTASPAPDQTRTPSLTATLFPTFTTTLEPSSTVTTATVTASPTLLPSITPSLTDQPTLTSSPESTVTPTDTDTILPTASVTPTIPSTSTSTATVSPSQTPTMPLTSTSTATAVSTQTQTITVPPTLTETATNTPPPDSIGPDGGEITSLDKKVKVIFPEGALSEQATIKIQPHEKTASERISVPVWISANQFDLFADSLTSGDLIHQFNKSIEIDVAYSPDEVQGDPSSLRVYYYNPADDVWIPLPSWFDLENNVLRASTDHFSLFATGSTLTNAVIVPALDSAQVAPFTGSASYSYPIEVPAGPGGIKPSISINYNSQSVEGANNKTQGSWVGMGWSLSAGGSIIRNTGAGLSWNGDDTYSFTVGGQSFQLIPVAQTTDYIDYKASDDNFWIFRRYLVSYYNGTGYHNELDQWVVWDKVGTRYTFDFRASYLEKDAYNVATYRPWGWFLTEMKDPAGNIITYSYTIEDSYPCMGWNQDGTCGYPSTAERAVYLDQISYANGHFTVQFVKSQQRTDFDYAWGTVNGDFYKFEKYNLDSIRVKIDGNILREYDLSYYGTSDVPIFPSNKWTPVSGGGNTGRALALKSIQEYGLGGIAANPNKKLPPTTFTYGAFTFAYPDPVNYNTGDFLHLSQIDNGYGGTASFVYETAPWAAPDGPTKQIAYSSGGSVSGPYPTQLINTSNSSPRPGVTYKVTCNFTNGGPQAAVIHYAVDYKDNPPGAPFSNRSASISVPVSSIPTPYSGYVTVRGDAVYWNLYVVWESGSRVDWADRGCSMVPVVNHYRVTSKFLSDAINSTVKHKYQFDYTYTDGSTDTAAVNDKAHSWILNTYLDQHSSDLSIEAYTEFRGHSKVTETSPNLITETLYSQDDWNQGQVVQVTQKDRASGKTLAVSISTYDPTTMFPLSLANYTPTNYPFCAKNSRTSTSCYLDRISYWLQLTSGQHTIYNDAGVAVNATQTTYEYDTTSQGYGNLIKTKDYSGVPNGGSWSWTAYRSTFTGYYPNVKGSTASDFVYLTGLPGYVNTYSCPNGTCDYTIQHLLSSTCTLYSPETGSPTLCSIPSNGQMVQIKPASPLPIGQRTLLRFDNGDYSQSRYKDELYGFIAGNRAITTVYTAEGLPGTFAGNLSNNGSQTTTTCYGTPNAAVPSCADDGGYYAFPRWQINALGQKTTWQYYDSAHGYFLMNETGPNNATTTAHYDVFGRITSLDRPYDTGTIQVSYSDSIFDDSHANPIPSYVMTTQKIDATTATTILKIYNGLNQLIQSQIHNANLTGVLKDILTDYNSDYNPLGIKFSSQSVPHVVTPWSGAGNPFSLSSWFTGVNYSITTYDALGRPLVTTNPNATTTEFHYDGLATTSYDALRNATVTTKNVWGDVISVAPSAGLVTTYMYNQIDQLTDTTQGSVSTHLVYDKSGRKTQMTDPDMGTWNYAYDALGNLTRQTDAKNQTTCQYYDTLNRLTTKYYRTTNSCPSDDGSLTRDVTYGFDGSFWTDNFDGTGTPNSANWTLSGSGSATLSSGLLTINSASGTESVYRPTLTINDKDGVRLSVKTGSSVSGRVIFLLDTGIWNDPSYRRYSIEINGGYFKRTIYTGTTSSSITMSYAGSSMAVSANTWYEISLAVDSSGNYKASVWKRDDPTQYAEQVDNYSSWGTGLIWRYQTQVITTNTTIQIDKYSEVNLYEQGSRTYMVDPSGSTVWQHDQRGRTVWEQKTITGAGLFTTSWSYNSDDSIRTLTYPGGNTGTLGETVTYAYLAQGLPNTLQGLTGYVNVTTYDEAGRLTKLLLGGLNNYHAYYPWNDDHNQGGKLSRSWTDTDQNIFYYYYQNGNIKEVNDSKQNKDLSYTYDALNRLGTWEKIDGSNQTDTYDSQGRLATKEGNPLQYNNPNSFPYHAPSALQSAPSVQYTYDANGNMRTRVHDAVTDTFGYDKENHVVSVDRSGGNLNVDFVYDGDGNRVKTTDSGVITVFIGNYYEYTPGATPTVVKNYYEGGLLVAIRSGNGSETGTTGLNYIILDHLGGVYQTINPANNRAISTHLYTPWGEDVTTIGTTGKDDFGFTGQRDRTDFGLYDYKARWYDPLIGHFVQPDTLIPNPYNPLAFDRFAYVNNNPVKYNDPSGHSCNSSELISHQLAGDGECGGYWGGSNANVEGGITTGEPQTPPQPGTPEFDNEIGLQQNSGGRPDVYRGGNPPQGDNPGDPNFSLKTQNNPYKNGDWDVTVDEDGNVGPGSGGLSTRSQPKINWKAPWKYPSDAPNPEGITIFQDKPLEDPLHWLWEPAWKMPLQEFKQFLQNTFPFWIPPLP